MTQVTVQQYNKTATIKIEGTAGRKHTKGIRSANLVVLHSADHFMVNGEHTDKADISFYQVIVAAYLTLQREKTEPAAGSNDAIESKALKIIINAARMRDAFKMKVSRN